MTRTLLTGVLLATLGACGPGGENAVDPHEATRSLEHQRTEVRSVARELVLAAEKHLPGTTHNISSGFRGCESSFPEHFRTFQYVARARIDIRPRSAPDPGSAYLASLRPVLKDARFIVEDVRKGANGFATLAAAGGDLSVSFVHTGGPFVGLDVSGRCIEVPEGQSDAWLRKQERQPEIR